MLDRYRDAFDPHYFWARGGYGFIKQLRIFVSFLGGCMIIVKFSISCMGGGQFEYIEVFGIF